MLDINSWTFVDACDKGKTKMVKMIINYVDLEKCGKEALVEACMNKHLEIAVHLIENGVDFQFNNNKLLRKCAKYGYVDIVRYLVEKGADINVIDTKYYDKDIQEYLIEIKSDIKLSQEKFIENSDNYDDYYSQTSDFEEEIFGSLEFEDVDD